MPRNSQVVPMMEKACVSILVANSAQLGQVDLEGCTLLLLSVKDVSEMVCPPPKNVLT